MRVVIARNHHNRHPRAPDLAECKIERRLADSARIEKIAQDQQQAGIAGIGDRDDRAERAPHRIAKLVAPRARPEAVGLQVDVKV